MKVIIAGSRGVPDTETVRKALREAGLVVGDVTEVVSGTARGADRFGEQVARSCGIPVKRFPADWNTFGKSAGYRRNAEMAAYADMLVAVWDGESRGTKHMIDLMKKQNKIIHIYKFVPPVSESPNQRTGL